MGLALFDSNVLMDALSGYGQAVTEISYFNDIAISAVVWIEVMSKPLADLACGKIDATSIQSIRNFLSQFTLIHSSDAIMEEAARIRSDSLINPPKTRLPDVIILATANVTGRLLVTRNKRDFRGSNVRLPYDVQNGHVFNIAAPPIFR
jgi:predicted nucleic acid-binding protein